MIARLIQGYLDADRAGIDFRLANARGIVDRVLRIVGLDHLLMEGSSEDMTVLNNDGLVGRVIRRYKKPISMAVKRK